MPAVPFQTDEMLIAMSREQAAQWLFIALKTIKPHIQLGSGRKLPHESDLQAKFAADAIVRHLEMSGVHWFRGPGAQSPAMGQDRE